MLERKKVFFINNSETLNLNINIKLNDKDLQLRSLIFMFFENDVDPQMK